MICTDKTGTLTENQMTVQRVWTPSGEVDGRGRRVRAVRPLPRRPARSSTPRRSASCSAPACSATTRGLSTAEDGWSVLGDPTEAALVVLAEKGGLRHEQEAALAPRLSELPFSSERKRMTTVHLVGGERVAYVKGAAE